MPSCTVCQHVYREEIDTLLVSHAPVRSIARQFGLIETSLRRHATAHLSRELARAAEGRDLERAETLLDRVESLEGELLAVLEQARDGGDPRIVLAAVRELRANFELVARLKGELLTGASVAIFIRFGVRDEAELSDLVEAGRRTRAQERSSTFTIEQCHDEAMELLLACLPRMGPAIAEEDIERIGRMVPRPGAIGQASTATVGDSE